MYGLRFLEMTMEKSAVTDNQEYCFICGISGVSTHHLRSGRGIRNLADADGLFIPLCIKHHDMIHKDRALEVMGKALGEMTWLKEYYRKKCGIEDDESAKDEFRMRYGKSFL